MSDDFDPTTGELVPLEDYRPPPGMLGSPGRSTLWAALIQFQAAVEGPQRTKTAKVQSDKGSYTFSYAPLEEIIRVIRKPLAQNGLGFRQYIVKESDGLFLRTVLFHSSGEWTGNDYPVFAEARRAQIFQSGITYARRQGLSLELGLAPEDDDDANAADQQQAMITPARAASRAHPAVAAPSPEKEEGYRAYRRLQEAIDTSEDAAALREIYDSVLDEWGTMFAAEIGAVRATGGDKVLEQLRRRVAERLKTLTSPRAASASRRRAPAKAEEEIVP